jgi:outer membrane receptor protein involved in Fe transport
LGGATDGGYMQQHADAVAGTTWASGGIMLAYDFAHNSRISAGQRSYTAALAPTFSLYPEVRRHALTFVGHQELAPGVEFSVDALFSKRKSTTIGGTRLERYEFRPQVETWSIAPELKVSLGGDWTLTAIGAWGRDRTHADTRYTPSAGTTSRTYGCFCNDAMSGEVDAEGALLALPGGQARLALGAGYRRNALDHTQYTDGSARAVFDVARESYFAFAEIYLPLLGPQQGLPLIHRLTLSAAVRYEDYPDLAKLATPRVGLAWSPTQDLAMKGSWSRSFKAPTLYQQYISYQAYLLPAAPYRAGTADQTIAYASGGNPDLKPERARSWTAGLEWKPREVEGLLLAASYFDLRYRDRVVQPINGGIARAFTDSGYASLVAPNPSADVLADLFAGSDIGLRNLTGVPYDPTKVAALLDNRNINVAAQAIHGFDFHVQWQRPMGESRALTFDLAGTRLISRQELTDALPPTRLAGTLFNPPRLRARGSVQYESPRLHAAMFANYTGKLTDARFATATSIEASTTFDFSASYDLIEGPGTDPGLAVSLTINNLFNEKPPLITQTGPTDTPFDSTNYSPIGRFVAVGISRTW